MGPGRSRSSFVSILHGTFWIGSLPRCLWEHSESYSVVRASHIPKRAVPANLRCERGNVQNKSLGDGVQQDGYSRHSALSTVLSFGTVQFKTGFHAPKGCGQLSFVTAAPVRNKLLASVPLANQKFGTDCGLFLDIQPVNYKAHSSYRPQLYCRGASLATKTTSLRPDSAGACWGQNV
jgi:hypothetical protein